MSMTRLGSSRAAVHEASTSDDPRLVRAVREYQAALEQGAPPPRDEFVARYQEIAAELAECLDALELVHVAAGGMRSQAKTVTTSPADSSEHQLPLGDFRIVRELGRGGMGVVYEAVQLSLGRRVALKVLPLAAAFDAVHLERFKNEAHAAARLHHSNIVPVHAVGSERGLHYYAMQLIDGCSLATVIEQLRMAAGKPARCEQATSVWRHRSSEATGAARDAAKRLGTDDNTLRYRPAAAGDALAASSIDGDPPLPGTPPFPAAEIDTLGMVGPTTVLSAARGDTVRYQRTVVGLIRQAALALAHAHQFGVVHRDIKPANLLLDARGNLWVTDFGLAQLQTAGQLTQTGDMLGTLRYMSPEQAAGDRVLLDHRTDIYSLGVTLYELLTLEPAFADSQRQVLLRKIIEDDPPAPRAHDAKIPRELETIVLKTIAKSPADRYATAEALADDLQRWLDDQPIVARRPTLLERAARWRRRHRGVMRAAVGFLLLALLGLLVSTLLIAREHADTKAAFDREIQQRAAAEESFRQARAAVDDFAQLGEQELANMPSMLGLRRRMLETALAYYQSFLEQREDDPTIRAELAATSTRVARMVDELALIEAFAPLMLLSEEAVQEELGLSDEQIAKIEAAFSALDSAIDEAENDLDESADTSEFSGQAQLAGARDTIVAQLEPQQKSRLDQLALQQRGPFAFRDPAVVKALQLTDEQREQIAKIIEEERPRGPGRPGHGPRRGQFDGRGGPGRPELPRANPAPDGPPGEAPGLADPAARRRRPRGAQRFDERRRGDGPRDFDGPPPPDRPDGPPHEDGSPPPDGNPRPDGPRGFDGPGPDGPPPPDGPRHPVGQRPDGPPDFDGPSPLGGPRPDGLPHPDGPPRRGGPRRPPGPPGDDSQDFDQPPPLEGPPPDWDEGFGPEPRGDGERPHRDFAPHGRRPGPPGDGPRPQRGDGQPPGEPRPDGPHGGPPHGPGERGPHGRGHDPDQRTIERIMEVLTPEQREIWKSMIGEPLDMGQFGPPDHGPF
ncbi:MAG: protein kinase [Pirellulales bacterium]|nr:protein kinase [Pirellulales bacterium]